MKAKTNGWLVAGCLSVFFSVLFALVGGLSRGYEVHSVLILAVSGLLLGAIAAPEVEPKAFRYPAVWQVCFGVLGGVLFVSANPGGPLEFMAGALIGGLLGFLAPYWLKYIPAIP
jgi:hypothetical protein